MTRSPLLPHSPIFSSEYPQNWQRWRKCEKGFWSSNFLGRMMNPRQRLAETIAPSILQQTWSRQSPTVANSAAGRAPAKPGSAIAPPPIQLSSVCSSASPSFTSLHPAPPSASVFWHFGAISVSSHRAFKRPSL